MSVPVRFSGAGAGAAAASVARSPQDCASFGQPQQCAVVAAAAGRPTAGRSVGTGASCGASASSGAAVGGDARRRPATDASAAGRSASGGSAPAFPMGGGGRAARNGNVAASRVAAVEHWQKCNNEARLGTPDAAAGTSTATSSNAATMDNDDDNNNMDTNSHHEYQNPHDVHQAQNGLLPPMLNEDEEDGVDHVEQHMLRKTMAAAAAAAEQRPTPPTEQLFAQLHEALALEAKYQPSLFLPKDSNTGEITCGTRDGAAQVLRCLKMWYELPSDVLFTAINLVDRFLTKMKVKPKHIACISVGSFLLAVNQLGLPKMDTEDLVTISQCRCTSGDLERMAGIIANKLGVQMGTVPVTSLACLRIIFYIFRNAAHELGCGAFFDATLRLPEMEMQMEILVCDAECTNMRATELALVLICTQLDAGIAKSMEGQSGHYQCLVDYAIEMQNLCRVSEGSLFESFGTIVKILSRYNGQHKMPYRQRLVWKLSSRTMRVLRPTDKLTSHLPTIAEHNVTNNNHSFASRFRTGSMSSEEGEDWPSSPVVPVYEQC